ncbi:Flp pilus assembly CpaF family ATPase [Pedobacter sp. CG_S7]|uniref:hypothetical protein n=1 Tax=Pedobacter sp. CG_S7 TaxID=3143930 RepID=UPI00339A882C
MEQNSLLDLAFDFVQFTDKNIFLTGKAGTGKTTFLYKLKKLSPKRMAVVARNAHNNEPGEQSRLKNGMN